MSKVSAVVRAKYHRVLYGTFPANLFEIECRRAREIHDEGSDNGEDCEQTKIKAHRGDKETEKKSHID